MTDPRRSPPPAEDSQLPEEAGPGLLTRIKRGGLMGVGGVLVLAGVAIAPLPGPFGLPVSVVGLILILRNSYRAKRKFIEAQQAKPKFVYPFRRLMRKNPEIAPVFWQQFLRTEKLVLKPKHRVLSRGRKAARDRIQKTFPRV